jgi:ech hydrogenase subunit D
MKQQFITIRPEVLLERAARFKKEGCRLVQILATRVEEGYELTYSFDKNFFLYHLRFTVPLDGSVMSVTSLFWYAFIWENEIHDLFGLDVRFIAPEVDYGGHFFHLAQKTPWHDLTEPQHAKSAVKVNLRSGLGVDASVVKKEDSNG